MDVSHILRAVSSKDLSCASGSNIKMTAEAILTGKIGDLNPHITKLATKSLLDQCIELPSVGGAFKN